MIRPDDLVPLSTGRANRREVVFRVDQIACRCGIEISCARAAHDGVPSSDQKTTALAGRLISRVREHIRHDSGWQTNHQLTTEVTTSAKAALRVRVQDFFDSSDSRHRFADSKTSSIDLPVCRSARS